MPSLHYGDVFAIPLRGGGYTCGRIMLDVRRQCYRKQLISDDSPLAFFNGALLVDLYDTVLETPRCELGNRLVAGVFVLDGPLRAGRFPVVGHQPVDPKDVEFPETFARRQGNVVFQRGEVVLDYPAESIPDDVFPTVVRAIALPDISAYYLHQRGLRKEEGANHSLDYADLRLGTYRAEVYDQLKMEPASSYREFAAHHGHNLERFY